MEIDQEALERHGRRMSGDPRWTPREALEEAIDTHAVKVMSAMRSGPFGRQLADAKAELLAAVDAYIAAGVPVPEEKP